MRRLFPALLLLLSPTFLQAAPYDEMDYGPFLSATFNASWPKNNVVLRGIALPFKAAIPGEKAPEPPVGKGKEKPKPLDMGQAGFLFDTELLRPAAWWVGGFVQYQGVAFNGGHGPNPSPRGNQVLGTRPTPGWAKDGDWKDPRAIPHGPLPRAWGRFKGLYRHDQGTVFAYTVGDCLVLEQPEVEVQGQRRLFSRTLNLQPSTQPLALVVADVEGGKGKVDQGVASLDKDGTVTVAGLVGAPMGAALEIIGGDRIILKLPARDKETKVKVVLWNGPAKEEAQATAILAKSAAPADLTPLTKGGKSLWTQTVATKGQRGDDKDAYTLDNIAIPFKNPYNSWMRIGGFDFFPDGKAAICTWSGDVWVVSGIDDDLQNVTWKRYAAGLFQPLGLKIVDNKIHVLGRDQITKLHDVNRDGEADFYECFNNDAFITTNFHEFTFELHTDHEGNFYFIKGGPVRPGGSGWDKITPHHGCIFKVSKDGSKLDVIARGFRAPNGMGVGPNGEITCGDNEGTWTPACPINWIKPGGFYGVPEFAAKTPLPTVRDNPLCWMPKSVDNSNGGQVWITGTKFGPLSGQMLHASYGTCTLYLVLKEEVAGQMQGGVVPLNLKFDSGICRGRFHEGHNALYMTGLRGWQTRASKDAGFYRIRYTGKPSLLPTALRVEPGALKLSFAEPLDKSAAGDADNFNIEQWNYRWTSSYGSAHYKVSQPKEKGQEEVEVDSATLSADGKTITLKIDDLKPVMQMKIAYNLRSAQGAAMKSVIHSTINAVGNLRGEIHPGELKILSAK